MKTYFSVQCGTSAWSWHATWDDFYSVQLVWTT